MTDERTVTPVRTVTGTIDSDQLGLALPHEHLINSIAAGGLTPHPDFPDLFEAEVTPELAWILNELPYACVDNCSLDSFDDALAELTDYRAAGGATVIEVTPDGQGQDLTELQRLARQTGLNIIAGGGWYLDRYHPQWAHSASVQEIADHFLTTTFAADDGDAPRSGVIGEIGMSPNFSAQEQKVLRAACAIQKERRLPMFIHLPGFVRYANRVLDIVLIEQGVPPEAVVLCHMDPSGHDASYQLSVAERGVWVEFDMIGMPYRFTHPGEGRSPSPGDTIAAIRRLVEAGFGSSLLFSHDMFLKSMLRKNGGNGLLYIPKIFRTLLAEEDMKGFDPYAVNTEHVRRLFELAAAR